MFTLWSTIILGFMLLNRKGHSNFLVIQISMIFHVQMQLSFPTKSNCPPHTSEWTATIIRLLKIQTCFPMGIPHFSILHKYSKKTAWSKNNSTKQERATLSQSVTLPLERIWFLCKMKKNGSSGFPVQLSLCKKSHTELVFNQLCYSDDFCIVQLDEGSLHKYFRA